MSTLRPGAPTVYVYYRVAGDPDRAAHAVGALLHDVATRTGAAACLLQRRGDASTWMEVYVPAGELDPFLQSLDACEARAGIAVLAEGGLRRRECFVPRP